MCEIFLSICSSRRRTALPRAAFVHNKSPRKAQQMWRVGAPRRPSATSCIVHPGPRLRGRFPEFLDCFSLKQLRKHLGLFDPLGCENKYLEGRNFCGTFPKSKGPCGALAHEVTGPCCVHGRGTWGPLVAFSAVPQEELQGREVGVTQGENSSHLRRRRRREFHG